MQFHQATFIVRIECYSETLAANHHNQKL